MKAVQIVIDEDLLAQTDRAARDLDLKRSALVRQALHAYLRQLRLQTLERRDRQGYESLPDGDDVATWEGVAAWPDD